MDTLTAFEQKINDFKQEQKKIQYHLDSGNEEQDPKVARNNSQKRKQQQTKEAQKIDEIGQDSIEIKQNKTQISEKEK